MQKKAYQYKAKGEITLLRKNEEGKEQIFTFPTERKGTATVTNWPETVEELTSILPLDFILSKLPPLMVYHDNLGAARRAAISDAQSEAERAWNAGATPEDIENLLKGLPAFDLETELRPGGTSGPTKAELAWATTVLGSPEALAKMKKTAKVLEFSISASPTVEELCGLKREIDRNLA